MGACCPAFIHPQTNSDRDVYHENKRNNVIVSQNEITSFKSYKQESGHDIRSIKTQNDLKFINHENHVVIERKTDVEPEITNNDLFNKKSQDNLKTSNKKDQNVRDDVLIADDEPELERNNNNTGIKNNHHSSEIILAKKEDLNKNERDQMDEVVIPGGVSELETKTEIKGQTAVNSSAIKETSNKNEVLNNGADLTTSNEKPVFTEEKKSEEEIIHDKPEEDIQSTNLNASYKSEENNILDESEGNTELINTSDDSEDEINIDPKMSQSEVKLNFLNEKVKKIDLNKNIEIVWQDGIEEIDKEAEDIAILAHFLLYEDESFDGDEIKIIPGENTYYIPNSTYDLMRACEYGDLSAVECLISNDMDVNCEDKNGVTPLIIASQNGHKNIVEFLLANNSKIDKKDKDGMTAFLHASEMGHESVVEYLLQKNANFNEKNNKGLNGLMLASQNGHKNITKILLNSGLNINEKDNDGMTAFMQASYNGFKEVFNYLLEKTSSLNEKDNSGKTALILASERGNFTIVETLVNNGAFVNEKDNENMTALMHASKNAQIYKDYSSTGLLESTVMGRGGEQVKIVEFLVKNEANVNYKSKNGWNALMFAAKVGSIEIMEILVKNNSDLFEKNNENETVFDIAAKSGNENTIAFLKQYETVKTTRDVIVTEKNELSNSLDNKSN